MGRETGVAMDRPVAIEDREVELTHLDQVLYPETGFAKAQVLDDYRRVAPYLLPHRQDRPVMLKRYPDGVLIQMQSPRVDQSHWLLVKLKDEYVGSRPEALEP